jgi:hypothetical protein
MKVEVVIAINNAMQKGFKKCLFHYLKMLMVPIAGGPEARVGGERAGEVWRGHGHPASVAGIALEGEQVVVLAICIISLVSDFKSTQKCSK